MILVALGSFYTVGILAAMLFIAYPEKLTERRRNAFSSGVLLGMGWLATYVLAQTIGLAHILVAIPVLLGSGIFALGYLTPQRLRSIVEDHLKSCLAFLEFVSPEALLPWLRGSRFVLGWLGLAV